MPVGQISLVAVRDLNLGPEYTHPAITPGYKKPSGNELIRAHPIPRNMAINFDFYYACVENLFQAYNDLRPQYPIAPLIINISGLLYDAGSHCLTKIVTKIKPHNFVHMSKSSAADHENPIKLHAFQAAVLQYQGTYHDINVHEYMTNPTRSRSELDLMQTQSYFHLKSIWRNPSTQHVLTWAWEPLSTTAPWEFCYQETRDRKQEIVGFAIYSEIFDPVSMIHILNGSIIHILVLTSSAVQLPYTTLLRAGKYQIPYFAKPEHDGNINPLDPGTYSFICVAMIRGFDLENKIVQVLVPRTHENLMYRLNPTQTIFVYGCCDTPEWAFLEDIYASMKSNPNRNSVLVENSNVWVDGNSSDGQMGHLSTLRRVRKFQT